MSGASAPPVRLQVLGPLRAWHGDSPIRLGPVQQRVVLGVLALHANRPINREQLIDAVWGPAAPTYAVNLVQKHVSALRRVLEPVREARAKSDLLSWTDAGYLLSLPEGALDLTEFDKGLSRARAAQAERDLPAAATALHDALGLWRGPVLDGLSSPLIDAERDRLAERRISAIEDRVEADLAVGEDHDLVAELRRLVAEHPLRERLRGLLMRALHRAGRQADALAAFREAHEHLLDNLGVEPGAELQALHRQILQGEPAPAPAAPPDRTPRPPRPAQLPHGMPDFTGRAEELRRLDALLHGDGTVVIATITGTAGVGKTSLAVHWAHRAADRFPDGQLYVNLRGFDPHGSAVEPTDALRGFLEAFAVPASQVPARLEDQAALFRSVLAGRRVLVVLDNARDAEQVQPLLPGSPGCLVVVTSRNQLSGLVTAGAVPIVVDLLTDDEARDFLRRRVGAERVAGDPDAVGEIVAACARLPLALAIVAARAAVHPQHSPAALAAELREAGGVLDAFGDARAVLSWSYQRLSPAAARLFRLLGLHPGADLALPAAASLAGLPQATARRLLAELSGTHLLEERTPGRFGFHDLLRAYAGEQVLATESEPERNDAVRRVLDHYLHTARGADRLLYPYRAQNDVDPPDPAATVVPLAEPGRALAWLVAEHPVLLAAIDQALVSGFPRHASSLAWTITAFLNYQGKWHDWQTSLQAALTACEQSGDAAGQALTLRLLSLACLQQGQFDRADGYAGQALELFAKLGDPAGQARLHLEYSRMLDRQDDIEAALERAQLALDLFRQAGDRGGEADALNWVGWFHSRLGFHKEALTYCHRSLDLHRQNGDYPSQADTWDALGFAHHHLGHYDEARACYEQALAVWRGLGDRYEVATTLISLGDTQQAAGEPGNARRIWQQARAILDELGHPHADQLRARLNDVPTD